MATSLGLYEKVPFLYVRKGAKTHGAKDRVVGVIGGERGATETVLLEDVTTTGKSSLEAVQALKEAGVEVRLIVAVVDREEGAAQAFKEAGVSFRALVRASELRTRRPNL